MAERNIRILVRKKTTSGNILPTVTNPAMIAEPFVNTYEGRMFFSGETSGVYEPVEGQTNVFEVGGNVGNLKVLSGINLNNLFVATGSTGQIITYEGQTDLSGYFLSGTSNGFTLASISDIAGSSAGDAGDVQFNDGSGGFIADGSFNYNNTTDTLNVVNFSAQTSLSAGVIYSGSTNLYDIFATTSSLDSTRVQSGLNTYTGGTSNLPTVNVSALTIDNITVSGDASYNGISASTIYSGSTDLYSIFQTVGSDENKTFVQNGLNTYTGGTSNLPTVNVSALTIDNITVSGEASYNGISASTIYSGSTDLYSIFEPAGSTDITRVQPGSNVTTGGTGSLPIISIVESPIFNNINLSGLTAGRVVYVGTGGALKDESGFEYNEGTNTLLAENINTAAAGNLFVGTGGAVIGSGGDFDTPGTGDLTVHGNLIVFGAAISAHTSQLYIEDNLIELNYNPTADTSSTSLGAGWSIQDGSGIQGTDVFFDIRGTGTTVDNRGFATNLNDIFIREDGTTSNPGGVRVLAAGDILIGGEY